MTVIYALATVTALFVCVVLLWAFVSAVFDASSEG
jgi:hypothetical protein